MADIARPVRLTRRTAQNMDMPKENALQKDLVRNKAAPAQAQHVRSALGMITNKTNVAQLVNVGKGGLAVSKSNNVVKDPVIMKPKATIGSKQVSKPVEQKAPLTVRNKQVPPTTTGTSKNVGVARRIANIVTSHVTQQVKPKASQAAAKPQAVIKPAVKPKPAAPVAAKPKEQAAKTEAACSNPDLNPFSKDFVNRMEDLYKHDADDAQNVAQYASDIYSYMTILEVAYCIPEGYVKECKFMTNQMRATVIDWLVGVHRQFKLMPETLYLTVSVFDRYMPTALHTPKSQLQLVGVTSLLIASKFEEIMCPTIGDCVYVTDNTYTKKQVVEMESKILAALSFNIGRPLPLQFLRRFTKVADATYEDHCTAKYFMELQLVRHEMYHIQPSMQAAAAILLSLYINLDDDQYEEFNKTDKSAFDTLRRLWVPKLHYFSKYSFDEVQETVKLLALVVLKGHSSNLQNVRKKYSSKSLSEMSQFVETRLNRIEAVRE